MATEVVDDEKEKQKETDKQTQINTAVDDVQTNVTTSNDVKNKNENDIDEETTSTDVSGTAEEPTTEPSATDTDADVIEERFRVDRKKLETLLQADENSDIAGSKFFHEIEQATNTTITWPAKLKIGAKSKKDPYIKVAGLPENRREAKQMVLSVMDVKSQRVTLKMDVSFTDHSHIIGKGGNTIKKVMQDTKCHIHFPDSNRTSSEKSNQVSIAGQPFAVESARRQIRELLPILLKFEIPSGSTVTVPDSNSPVITNIAQMHNVTISFQQQLRSYAYFCCVKGLHSDPFAVRDAVLKVLEHLTGTVPVTVHVTTQMEIDPKHHIFIHGRNGANVKKITQSTGASIHFPDPNDPNARKSTVIITGSIEAAVTAKVYLLQYLPLILMFDVRDGENEELMEQGRLTQLSESYDVQVTVKPKPKQFCKSIIVKSYEKNAPNIYKTRLHLFGEDPKNMPYLMSPLATLLIPQTNNSPLHLFNGIMPQQPMNNLNNLMNQSNSPLSPPLQSSSPLVNQSQDVTLQAKDTPYLNVSSAGQRIIGSEMKMLKQMGNQERVNSGDVEDKNNSSDGLSNARSVESILDAMGSSTTNSQFVNKDMDNLTLSGSWSRKVQNSQMKNKQSTTSIDSGLCRSQEELSESARLSLTNNLINNLVLQRNPNFNVSEYEFRKKMAQNAMQSQVQFGKVRTPTDVWAGLGLSNSMPDAVFKELLNSQDKRTQLQILNGMNSSLKKSPTNSLDSSASSNGSATSANSHGMGHQSPTGNKLRRPPPGLEDSHPNIEKNSLLLNNNYEYNSVLSPNDPLANSAYANVKCMADLLSILSLEQYTEAFEKEEVDVATFMSLTDDDLKELGISTLGARKRMTKAMRELQALHNSQLSGYSGVPPLPNSYTSSFFPHRPLDIAAQSLRW